MPAGAPARAAAGAMALALSACSSGGAAPGGGTEQRSSERPVVSEGPGAIPERYDLEGVSYRVGSKGDDEQLILGYIASHALRAAGADVSEQMGLGGTAEARSALTDGEIDLYWEYTGTGWALHLGNGLRAEERPSDLRAALVEEDLARNDIRWLEAASFDNTYGLAVRQQVADEVPMTISAIAEQVGHSESLTLCIGSEFSTREDALPGLEAFYGFEWPDQLISIVDTAAAFRRTAEGSCTYGAVFTSNGLIDALDLRLVTDDRDFFPPFRPAVTIRENKYQQRPAVGALFAEIARALDLEEMQDLNAQVSVEDRSPEDVALDWLTEHGFVRG